MPTSATRRRRRSPGGTAIATLAVLGVVLGLAALALLNRPDTGGLAATGERNAMGMPVVSTPGEATGTARAGGIEVDAADWELGRVPLNVAVLPGWTLHNRSDDTVTLGEPHPEVRQGCCPGPLTLGTATLAPGESTTLTFDLAMHEGMDGWHDIAVHVPVTDSGEVLSLTVTGDFRS